MKFRFTFKEISYGSVEIESDHMPGNSEVIDAIMDGNAYFGDTEYEDIIQDKPERTKPNPERHYER
jgi:hypothetical protein